MTFKWGTKRKRQLVVIWLTNTLKIVVYQIKYFCTLYEHFSLWESCLVETQIILCLEMQMVEMQTMLQKISQQKHKQNKLTIQKTVRKAHKKANTRTMSSIKNEVLAVLSYSHHQSPLQHFFVTGIAKNRRKE